MHRCDRVDGFSALSLGGVDSDSLKPKVSPSTIRLEFTRRGGQSEIESPFRLFFV